MVWEVGRREASPTRYTVLFEALRNQNFPFLKLALDNITDKAEKLILLRQKNSHGKTAYQVACDLKNEELKALLIQGLNAEEIASIS